jgi:formylglycine-generating enzyme required for sulfatase activity
MASIGNSGEIYYVPKPGGYDEGIAIQGGFQIGRYEVTYALWHEVIFWASSTLDYPSEILEDQATLEISVHTPQDLKINL